MVFGSLISSAFGSGDDRVSPLLLGTPVGDVVLGRGSGDIPDGDEGKTEFEIFVHWMWKDKNNSGDPVCWQECYSGCIGLLDVAEAGLGGALWAGSVAAARRLAGSLAAGGFGAGGAFLFYGVWSISHSKEMCERQCGY